MTSNDGFSVVAPISVTMPCSTAPNRESCCALLKRCISSMKRNGAGVLKNFCFLAWSMMSRTSFTPEFMADSVKSLRSSAVATNLASVVLPTPGGPHRMNEGTLPVSMNLRKTPSLPTRCACPMYSSSVCGLSRSANGVLFCMGFIVRQPKPHYSDKNNDFSGDIRVCLNNLYF